MAVDTKFQLAQHAMFQKVVDETVILDTQSGQYYTLDVIATEMVELLNNGQTVSEVVSTIFDNYDSQKAVIEQDLQELIKEMQSKGLLVEKQV